jgi:hypothetical protein
MNPVIGSDICKAESHGEILETGFHRLRAMALERMLHTMVVAQS